MLIDRYLPQFDVVERHAVKVRADTEAAYRAVRRVDLARSRTVRVLFAARGLPLLIRRHRRDLRSMTIDDLLRAGFVLLEEEPGVEIVLGLVGRFWTPTGKIRRIEPAAFESLEAPGEAKVAWNFRVGPRRDGGSFVLTETRVRCPDERTRKRFLLYWSVIGPFSGLIRKQALALVKADAEGSGQPGTS